MPWISIGSVRIWPTMKRGLSDAYGFWKMIWMRRLYGMNSRADIARMSRPSKCAVPAVASCSRISVRPTVVLPEPDSPTRPSVLPLGRSNDTSCTARNSRRPKRPSREKKLFDRLRTDSTTGSSGATPRGRSSTVPGSMPAPLMKSSITGSRAGRRSSCGRQRSSAVVYVSCGRSNTSRAGPCSRISPSRITMTWSAISPTTARSCVMNSTDICRRFCSWPMSSRICFWIVTSSAVVGSSAISSLGSQAIAIAIITRCCCPPDICDGNMSMRRAGSGMPTSASRSTARLRAAAPARPMCSRSTSSIWKPTVNTGFSDVIGSWKIIEMSAPRRSRSSARPSRARLRPPYRIWLLASTIEFSGGRRPRIASEVTDLPEPDSPTSATVAFCGMSNEMPRTASYVVLRSRRNETDRSRTRTSGSARFVVGFISAPSCP